MREKSGETEFFHGQGNTEFYLKVSKKSGNFYYLRVATWFGKGKVVLFQKAATKELFVCGFIAGFIGKEFVFCGQCKVREKLGIFIILK